MKNFTVTFKGRNTRSLLGDSGKDTVVIEAWDKGEARIEAEKMARQTLVLAGVKCDEVTVVDVRRGRR